MIERAVTCFLSSGSTLEVLINRYRKISYSIDDYGLRLVINMHLDGTEDFERIYSYLVSEMGCFFLKAGRLSSSGYLLKALKEENKKIVLAESCTGGMVAKMITDIPGSSNFFLGSFVTYSNDAKAKMLGISPNAIERFGAVSRETVENMLSGALNRSNADIALAVSGIAGPGGGSKTKPVGTVWIGVMKAGDDSQYVYRMVFEGDRNTVRQKSAVSAMLIAETVIKNHESLDNHGNWQYNEK